MKFLIAVSLTAFSVGALAQSNDLNTMKSQANSHITEKMNSLQTAKSCVNNASSMEKFKACKYDMHEDMKKHKMEKMEERKKEMNTEE